MKEFLEHFFIVVIIAGLSAMPMAASCTPEDKRVTMDNCMLLLGRSYRGGSPKELISVRNCKSFVTKKKEPQQLDCEISKCVKWVCEDVHKNKNCRCTGANCVQWEKPKPICPETLCHTKGER